MKVFLHGRLRYHEVFVSILNLTGGDVGYVGGLKKKKKERERNYQCVNLGVFIQEIAVAMSAISL